MIDLHCRAMELKIDPQVGGSIRALRWRGFDLLRPQNSDGILSSASFPMVPFCNRIAGGKFVFEGRRIAMAPNHPSAPEEPVLHGIGWLRLWHEVASTESSASLIYVHDAGEWPWRFDARQQFALGDDSATIVLSVTNRGERPMPAGLGFHPFFPRSETTRAFALHRGERQADGSILARANPVDWWEGEPIGSRPVDTTYSDRSGDIRIEWSDRGVGARLSPSANLPFTQFYVPEGEDFFCAEPVSHSPEAFLSGEPETGWRTIAPNETFEVSLEISAYALPMP